MAIGCLLSVLIFSLSLCFLYWRRKVHERREERDLALSRALRHTAESWVTFSPSIADDVVYGRLTPAADSVCYLQMFDKPPSYETLCKGHLMVNGSPLRLEAQAEVSSPPPYQEESSAHKGCLLQQGFTSRHLNN
ncbi:uncharacterized protein LOC120849599 [Ixodes scapularis]|uniref:uncharacterized protein LOC120849599 n=1 Tax=Ixodes scapularis TaxID=6945 RepID=UPI001A9ECCCB|nr:uncharacterized protein LOC120849599 [Ixodes scapularis]